MSLGPGGDGGKLRNIHLIPQMKLFRIADAGPLEVWVVDGDRIRSQIYIDFAEGGNSHAYPWIPGPAIWLDNAYAGAREAKDIILHELTEYNAMSKGVKYDDAHSDYANPVEQEARDHPEKYDILFQEQVKIALGNAASASSLAKVRKK